MTRASDSRSSARGADSAPQRPRTETRIIEEVRIGSRALACPALARRPQARSRGSGLPHQSRGARCWSLSLAETPLPVAEGRVQGQAGTPAAARLPPDSAFMAWQRCRAAGARPRHWQKDTKDGPCEDTRNDSEPLRRSEACLGLPLSAAQTRISHGPRAPSDCEGCTCERASGGSSPPATMPSLSTRGRQDDAASRQEAKTRRVLGTRGRQDDRVPQQRCQRNAHEPFLRLDPHDGPTRMAPPRRRNAAPGPAKRRPRPAVRRQLTV